MSEKSVIPKNAKKPEDRKQKEETAKSVEVTREIGDREVDGFEVTYKGITVFVPKEAFDDFELLDDLAALDKQKAHAFPSLLRRLVGDDYASVMDGLRDAATGRVAIADGTDFVNSVLAAVNPS